MSGTIVTYRSGQKIVLEKSSNKFVVRRLPDELEEMGYEETEQVSSASSIVEVPEAELNVRMLDMRQTSVAHHLYVDPQTGEEVLLSDRVLITFREFCTEDEINALFARHHLVVLERYDVLNYLVQLTTATGVNPTKLVVRLIEDEQAWIENADMDLNFRVKRFFTPPPADPFYLRQWHLHQRFQHPDADPRASSNCEAAWMLLGNLGNPDIVIGITDDGCDLSHRDFNSPGKFAGWGYFQGTSLWMGSNPQKMYQPGSNHGTSCAGVAAALADGLLTVGAAPGCRLFPIKWESEGPSLLISDSKFLEALNRLSDQVDILSNSWGITPRSTWSSVVVNRIRHLTQHGGRRGKGMVFLFAAGNENCPIQYSSATPIPFAYIPSNGQVRTATLFSNNLTGIPGVLFVAALASNAQRSHYSNYGPGISITAPSNNVHTYRFMTVPGLPIITVAGGNAVVQFGGTSSATPLVAGIAALVLSANPNLSALEVAQLLQKTASKDLNFSPYRRLLNHPSWDVSPVAPFDRGQFQQTGAQEGSWSPWFGFGKADAEAAVRAALGEPAVQQEPQVVIVAALVNPKGNDTGKETVTLLNTGQVRVHLKDWLIQDGVGRQDILPSLYLEPWASATLTLRNAKLPNTGGKIALLQPGGARMDEVQYTRAQARAEGVVLEFVRER